MEINLLAVNYDQFKNIINVDTHGQTVYRHGQTTLLYKANTLIAAMRSAYIDRQGECHPVSYFISA
jgi:hypothetical protein